MRLQLESLESRIALSEAGPIPPNVELLESQTTPIVQIVQIASASPWIIPGNLLGDYINQWGDPVWNLNVVYNPNQGPLVDLPVSNIPNYP